MTVTRGIDAKLDRARHLLGELASSVVDFRNAQPFEIAVETPAPPDGGTLVRLSTLDDPPLELAVRAGEIVHHVRSVLDHGVCALAERSGVVATIAHAFPVVLNDNAEGRKKLKRRLKGLSVAATQRIEELQPFRMTPENPAMSPLAVLDKLWNTEKHRTLPLTSSVVAATQAFALSDDGSALLGGQLRTNIVHGPIERGSPIAFFSETGPQHLPPNVVAVMDVRVRLDGLPGRWASLSLTVVMEELLEYVQREVLEVLHLG